MTDLTPDLLAQITTEMRGDGVWIDPDYAAAAQITPAQERELEQAVAAAEQGPVPVRVMLTDVPYRSQFRGSAEKLVAWLDDDLDSDFAWVTVGFSDTTVDVQKTLEDWSEYWDVSTVVQTLQGPVGQQAVEAVGLTQMSAEELAPRAQAARQERQEKESRNRPEEDGGVPSGWIVTALVVAGALLLVGGRSLWRRWRASRTGFRLSGAVVRQVSAAENERLRAAATQRTDALGEALAGTVDLSGPAGRSALDHHAAARGVLAGATSAEDLMGALVLANRGTSALEEVERAGADAVWVPPVPCWENPSHDWAKAGPRGGGSGPRTCAACRAEGAQPDTFRVLRAGTTVPWYATDLGVWTRTGYGTTEPDLPAAVGR